MTRSRDVADTQDNLGGAVAPFVAGKNKIINGDFYWNQRSFTTTTTNATFGFDRWFLRTAGTGGTSTYSAQTFTPGTAPVSGYEGVNFARIETSGFTGVDTIVNLRQTIEDVRTLANQTVTVSFWAKAATGTPNIGFQFSQQFGSGGTTAVNTSFGIKTITTSWQRYSFTGTLPSIAGTTIGSGSFLLSSIWVSQGSNFSAGVPQVGVQNNTFDVWGVQIEAGNVATPFQTASGSIGGELALCQRYYFRNTPGTGYGIVATGGVCFSTTTALFGLQFPVTMRIYPTSPEWGNLQLFDSGNTQYTLSAVTVSALNSGPSISGFEITASGLTAGRPCVLRQNNNAAGFIGFSAEL